MFYSEQYIFNILYTKFSNLKIVEKKENNKTVYSLDCQGFKAKIDLESFLVRLDDKQTKKSDKLIEKFITNIELNFLAQEQFSKEQFSKEKILKNCYPILRATSFGKNSTEQFVTTDHTNETKILYSIDLKNSYKIITSELINKFCITKEDLHNAAMHNLKSLPLKYNSDTVANNTFYFLNSRDGYDGSRLLNEDILKYFYKKIGSEFYVGLPHQDVLIIADIKNKHGLEILQKMMVHFFAEGRVPITTITFKYDNEKLESLFIFVE